MKRIVKGFGTIAVAVLLSGAFAATGSASDAMKLKVGDKAPDFRLKEVTTGQMVSLSDYFDPKKIAERKERDPKWGPKVVMIDFWATWCDICKKEMPSLVKMQNKWKDKNFEILSVVLQSGDTKEVKKIITEKKLNFPVLLDQDLTVATKLYGLSGPIPLKVVIDSKGIIQYSHVGDYAPGDDELPMLIGDLTKEIGK